MSDYTILKENMAPQLPTIDHTDHEGDVLVSNPDGSQIHVHYTLVEPWMTWQSLGDDTDERHAVASARHQWTSDHLPSLSLADEDHEVMILHDMIVRYVDYSLVPAGAKWCPTLSWYLEQYDSGNPEEYSALASPENDSNSGNPEKLAFASISRSFDLHGKEYLDAVMTDGTAWYKNISYGYNAPWKRHEAPDDCTT